MNPTWPTVGGGAYRSTDVDIEASSTGGYDVGWVAASEWLQYESFHFESHAARKRTQT
jgi:hypothetical protein